MSLKRLRACTETIVITAHSEWSGLCESSSASMILISPLRIDVVGCDEGGQMCQFVVIVGVANALILMFTYIREQQVSYCYLDKSACTFGHPGKTVI